jgi:hypothetical protein
MTPTPRKNTQRAVPERNQHKIVVSETEPNVEGVSTRTEHTESETCPHRGLVRLQLRADRCIIPLLVHGDADMVRLGPQDAVEHDRGYAQANRRSKLRHRLEQCPCDTLLMRQRYLGDEQCSRCEHEVHAEHNQAGRREAEGPIWCTRINDGEKDATTSGHKCAGGYKKAERRSMTSDQ